MVPFMGQMWKSQTSFLLLPVARVKSHKDMSLHQRLVTLLQQGAHTLDVFFLKGSRGWAGGTVSYVSPKETS